VVLIRRPVVIVDGARAAALAAVLRNLDRAGALDVHGPRIAAELRQVAAELDEAGRAWLGQDFRSETPDLPDLTTSDSAAPGRSRGWMGAEEAGVALGLTSRRVGQLAERLGGRRNERGQWRFDPQRITAEAERRKAG
jgi:hypothetical protein